MPVPRKYSPEATRQKLLAWADRRERCHRDVREKLEAWGIPYREREELISWLISLNALNEQRYALAFASDHARFQRWGAKKIIAALRARGISDYIITKVQQSMDPEEEMASIRNLAEKKRLTLKEKDPAVQRHKIAQYLIRKGFEPEKVWRLL
ncbi:MAG: RecX family transcriptional regulator [Flavobacteriales bacterium]|nr:RecX family transcriptional regulator [Flavobacteriales bacterium]